MKHEIAKPLFYDESLVPAFIRKIPINFEPIYMNQMVKRIDYDIQMYRKLGDGYCSREQHEHNVCTMYWLKTHDYAGITIS